MTKYTGAVGSSSAGITVTAGSGTKGGWVQLFSSTPAAAKCLWLYARPASTASYLLDIGTGASGSEQVLVPDVLIDGSASANVLIPLPIAIASGARVAVRAQSSAANSILVVLTIDTSGFTNGTDLTSAVALGVSGNGGTVIDPGATGGTKGSWVQLSASSPQDLKALVICTGNNANATNQLARFFVDVGTGASGSETIIVPDIFFNHNDAEAPANMASGPYLVDIAAGTRIAVRAQCNITDATDRLFSCVILGFYGEPGSAVDGTISLTGQADLGADSTCIRDGSISIAGIGSSAAQGKLILSASISLGGIGSSSALGNLILSTSTTLGGTVSLGASGSIILQGDISIGGVASLLATGELLMGGGGALIGTGQLVANGACAYSGAVSLGGIGTSGAVPDVLRSANISIGGVASLSADGSIFGVVDGSVNLQGAAITAAEALVQRYGTVLLSGQWTMSPGGGLLLPGNIDISGVGLLGADGLRICGADLSVSGNMWQIAMGNVAYAANAWLNMQCELMAAGSISEAPSGIVLKRRKRQQIIRLPGAVIYRSRRG